MYGVVIESSRDCWSGCIRYEGIVGYQCYSIGFGWHEITQHGIANLMFHGFPTALCAQEAAFPLVSGFFTGAS
jgi:hypothetical protein